MTYICFLCNDIWRDDFLRQYQIICPKCLNLLELMAKEKNKHPLYTTDQVFRRVYPHLFELEYNEDKELPEKIRKYKIQNSKEIVTVKSYNYSKFHIVRKNLHKIWPNE